MDNAFKIIIGVVLLILVLFLGLFLVYSVTETPSNDNVTSLNVSSEGPLDLYAIISDIKTNDYYIGYDPETLQWMESLGSKKVFVSSDAFVLMDSGDAMKIPSEYATDVCIEEFIECNIVENRSLGEAGGFKDVLLVNDVKYVGQEIHYLQV